MLELMDKSPKVSRFIWAFFGASFIVVVLYLLPPLINAIAQWQQLKGQ